MNKRDIERWKRKNIEYPSVEDFIRTFEVTSGIHTVWVDAYPIDILLDYTPNKPAVFVWKGNTRRTEKVRLPVFVGFSMIKAADATRISISDPTMYFDESLGLAWYTGNIHHNFQNIISQIVTCIGRKLDTRIIHTGGSGGGFAAMFFSKYNPGSLAIPFNPQIDFLKYEPKAVHNYLKAIDNISNVDEAKQYFNNHIIHDLAEFYRSHKERKNYILYLQNINDSHVNIHLKYFLADKNINFNHLLGFHRISCSNMVVYISDRWGGEHEPPPREFLEQMFIDILNDKRPILEIINDQNLLNKWNEL